MRQFLRTHFSLLLFASVSLLGRAALADHYVVPTPSMAPSVDVGDHVVVDKRAFGLRIPLTEHYVIRYATPARGDVVVFDSPVDGEVWLKRVIALPGEVVSVRDGEISIDGVTNPIEDGVEDLAGRAHRVRRRPDGGPDFGPTRVPPGMVLVMGDNRGNSLDGRTFGFLPLRAILGRALGVVWRDGAPHWQRL